MFDSNSLGLTGTQAATDEILQKAPVPWTCYLLKIWEEESKKQRRRRMREREREYLLVLFAFQKVMHRRWKGGELSVKTDMNFSLEGSGDIFTHNDCSPCKSSTSPSSVPVNELRWRSSSARKDSWRIWEGILPVKEFSPSFLHS